MSPRVRVALLAVGLSCAMPACLSFHAAPLPGEDGPGDRVVEVDGVMLQVREEGPSDAPAVIMIHGYGSSRLTWSGITPRLAERFRVIALDLKGFGRSARPVGDYSPEAQAALIIGLMDRLGVSRAALVGHSWGGSIALATALAAPARVTRLGLYGAFVYDEQIPPYFRWAKAAGLGEVVFAMNFRERPDERLARAFYNPDLLEERYVERVTAELERPGTLAASLAAVRGMDFVALAPRYKEVRQPALLLWGREDRVSPPAFGERLAAELPSSRLLVFPRCGHFPHVEARDASTTALIAFLTEGAK